MMYANARQLTRPTGKRHRFFLPRIFQNLDFCTHAAFDWSTLKYRCPHLRCGHRPKEKRTLHMIPHRRGGSGVSLTCLQTCKNCQQHPAKKIALCKLAHVDDHTCWGHGQIRGSIVVSISACHAEDPGSIPGRGVFAFLLQPSQGRTCLP